MQSYIADRRSKRIFQYGILRRAKVLIRHFKQLDLPATGTILDIGTADGLVLRHLTEHTGFRGIGVDIQFSYLQAARGNVERLVQADGRCLPFPPCSVDAIVSTAAFKHIEGLEKVVGECHRLLRPKGKLVVIDPTPLGIHLGRALRYYPQGSIFHVLNLEDLRKLLAQHGFVVISEERFTVSPVPFPGCDLLERGLKRIGLDRLFLNQAVCAERIGR